MKTPAEVAAERQSQEDEARQARVDLRDCLLYTSNPSASPA